MLKELHLFDAALADWLIVSRDALDTVSCICTDNDWKCSF